MKILFIASGNSAKGVSVITANQAQSLRNKGIQVDIFTIKGRGVLGYLKNVFFLRKYLKETNYDVYHAHYFLSAIVATLAGVKPICVSLMGSDVMSFKFSKRLIKIMNALFWSNLIVKSSEMKAFLNIKKCEVIPNGVDLNNFYPIPKDESLSITGWDKNKKHILFAADPGRKEKNYPLAEKAIAFLNRKDILLHVLRNEPHERLKYLYNSADVVILTSLWEGSPNVIKEAMACGRPIVSTNVGDVEQNLRGIEGCFVCHATPENIAASISCALKFGETSFENKLKNLSNDIIADKLIEVYKSCNNS